ncbi:MAG: hypothetical protein VR73_07210 [Gammaproteobacteria bacterium BRH_c0]|nr:MAG: hypothetical protein VR73_07210 [Gammaproteobacteria bacterium BRH_c0]
MVALPVDDPWWDTHYPPNGWGCRCWIISATEAQLKRWGIEPAKAPPIETTWRVNTSTGLDYGQVPIGIDPGWDYNVGKAWLGSDIAFGEKLMALPDALRAEVFANLDDHIAQLNKGWHAWLKERAGQPPRGYAHTIGYLSSPVIDALKAKNMEPVSATVVVFDNQTNHVKGTHKDDAKRISLAEFKNLPAEFANHSAVLLHGKELVFVMKGHADGRNSRAVVAVNLKRKGNQFSSLRSLGRVHITDLRKKEYELIWGKL